VITLSPVFLTSFTSCPKLTPGSMVAVISSLISRMRFILLRSRRIPPLLGMHSPFLSIPEASGTTGILYR